jgi:hypothetical protein
MIKDNILQRLVKILVSFESKKFGPFIKNLLLLREDISGIDPELFHTDFVDFLLDNNMWNWIISGLDKDPTEFDWEAAQFIAADIKDIITNNKFSV